MEKEIFPQMIEVPYESGKASYEKKCIFHERLLYHYLMKKIEGWSVKNFLDAEGIKRYALYAISDFSTLTITDLKNSNCAAGIICDKNAEAFQFQFHDWPVILPDELARRYKEGKIDKIIVMSVLHENEIIDGLIRDGILLNDIISFVSVIYS